MLESMLIIVAKESDMRGVMKAFSMIELIFVIVILGIIASIAIPKISVSRLDAFYAAIMADIASVQSAIQQKFLLEDVSSSNRNGQLILDTAGLSHSRWVASGNGIRLAKNGVLDSTNNCVSIDFVNDALSIKIDSSVNTPLCKKLAKTYPNAISIPLDHSAIKF